jgi:4-carboxymuconolactone decarboxylase
MHTPRYQQGWNRLRQVDAAAGERVIASLQDISPDLGRYIIEFGFGEVYCRPGLSLSQRELATIAALTALGHAIPQLKVHIAAGLNVGLSQQEIHETILQMAVYAGFPAALNGMFAAKEVFAEHAASAATPCYITTELRLCDAARRDEAVSALQQLASASRLEPGCLDFRLHADTQRPDRFMLWQQFRDQDAVDQHDKEQHSQAYQALQLTEPVQHWHSAC